MAERERESCGWSHDKRGLDPPTAVSQASNYGCDASWVSLVLSLPFYSRFFRPREPGVSNSGTLDRSGDVWVFERDAIEHRSLGTRSESLSLAPLHLFESVKVWPNGLGICFLRRKWVEDWVVALVNPFVSPKNQKEKKKVSFVSIWLGRIRLFPQKIKRVKQLEGVWYIVFKLWFCDCNP